MKVCPSCMEALPDETFRCPQCGEWLDIPMPRNPKPLNRKNPWLAAVLALAFGPFGYLYLNWRYALGALMIFAFFWLNIGVLLPPYLPEWMNWAIWLALSFKAFTLCTARNGFIEADSREANFVNAPGFVVIMMTDLLGCMAIAYAYALGLYISIVLYKRGNTFTALLFLFAGTGLLVWLARVVFSYLGWTIDNAFLRGKNEFFKQLKYGQRR